MDEYFDVDGILDEVEEAERKTSDKVAQKQRDITFYPLDSVIGNGISSLRITDIRGNLAPGAMHGFSAMDSLYAKSCEKGRQMLYRSAALLQQGEEFALKTLCYGLGNPPLYLRYYQKKPKEQTEDENHSRRLLVESIDELFSKALERHDHEGARRSRTQFQLSRKRKRARKDEDSNESWLIKYNPRYFSDLLTEETVNIEVLNWLRGWKCSKLYTGAKGAKQQGNASRQSYSKEKETNDPQESQEMRKILLLGGPAGVGKSTLVNVLARHCGFNIVEINASEDRSRAKLLPIIKGIVMTNAISRDNPNLCLLEEVDGLYAAEGQIIGALKELSQKGQIKRPIVCICNDLYSKNLRELRQISKVIVVDTCDAEALKHRLMQIADLEGYKVDEDIIEDLMKLHNNDVRSCITALEFIIKNPELADNLDAFAKDRSQDLIEFLRELFNPKSSSDSLRTSSVSVSSTLGTPTMCNLIIENVAKIGIKSQSNAVVLYDLLAQGDILQNTSWLQVILSYVKLMRLKSAFKFILPPSLHSHLSGIQMSKNTSILRAIRANTGVLHSALSTSFMVHVLPILFTIITNLRIGYLSHVNMSRSIREMDVLWEAFSPMKGTPINRLIRLAILLQIYGIDVVEVQETLSLDPPIIDLYGSKNTSLSYELCKILKEIIETKTPMTSVKRPRNLQAYLQELSQLGFVEFMKRYNPTNKLCAVDETKLVCRKNGKLIPPITFTELLELETQHLNAILKPSDFDFDSKTSGMYKFLDEECGAVRYIINDI